jgi:UDP-2,3-diacylglucosamine pyrophosphatase LpxH
LRNPGHGFVSLRVPGKLTRVFSDVHYGDRASRVAHLGQLRPLVTDVDAVILNGDTTDTRTGPNPGHTAACRDAVAEFAAASDAPLTFLTGNHDPDMSDTHWQELAGGSVLVLHGDILFEDMVPWGRDARLIRRKITAALGETGLASLDRMSLEERVALWREVAVSVPQRHQSERHPLKYALRFAMDTVWPPLRIVSIFQAWGREPELAAAMVRRVRPHAKYVLLGHTHRPAIRKIPGGPTIINTGSFTAPFGGYAVDLLPDRLRVLRIDCRGGEFHPGGVVEEFPLANA